jgi:hypothetical protein
MMEENERYKRAKQRVESLKSFYIHVLVYIFVNIWLFVINLITAPGEWWFYWPLIGWGIGLTAHGIGVLAGEGWMGREWEDRKIREALDQEAGDEPRGE